MEQLIHVPAGTIALEGMLKGPDDAKGLVLFAHGSGSSRFSPRNNYVADILNKAGFCSCLIDLLSKLEDENYQTRFDIALLNTRLQAVITWLGKQPDTRKLSIGLFGASTGAAAALEAAAALGKDIRAVVSRGGRPDMAMKVLAKVVSPTLIIVGGNDFGVIELNEEAFNQLTCTKEFSIVPHATHLFEEPGCLDEVARLAMNWFEKYL